MTNSFIPFNKSANFGNQHTLIALYDDCSCDVKNYNAGGCDPLA